MKAITKKQKETLKFVSEFTTEHGMAPTYSNIADNYGVSIPSAYSRVRSLSVKNMVITGPGKRAIVISELGKEALTGMGNNGKRGS
ncbi:MAG: LexA family protein [Spirochaetota bacterium]